MRIAHVTAPIILFLVAILAGPALKADDATLAPHEAHAKAMAGEIVLVDIRTPAEWRRTGVPAGAVAVDMRDPAFEERLLAALSGDRTAPVAVICASGGRSARMQERLAAAGFPRVLDVTEGVVGGWNGPGWIARGLPVTDYSAAAATGSGRQ